MDFDEYEDEEDLERAARPSGRDEMNLAEFPFAQLKRQQGEEDVFTYKGWITDKHGSRHQQVWTVRGAGGLGLPTEYDERVVVALMAISAEQGFPERKVPFSVYQVLKIMGIQRSQRAYEAVERALARLVGVTIYAEGAFWDNAEKEWIQFKAGFHLIEKYWLAYQEKDAQVRASEGVPAYFVWSDDIWKSIQDGYIKYLDLDFYFGLNLPLSRRLYRFLDKRMYYQDDYEIDIFDLAGRLGMAHYDYPSEVARKLQPALEELIAQQFLAEAEVVKVRQYTRMRFRRAGARLSEPQGVTPSLTTPLVSREGPEGEVMAALMALGFTAVTSQHLVQQYGPDLVREKMDYLRWEQEVRRKQVRNPHGWLRRAIEEDYSAPAGYDRAWWEQATFPLGEESGENEWLEEPAETISPTGAGSFERQLWEQVLRNVEGQMTRATFQNLFAQTTLVKVQEDIAIIAVPSPQVQEWLENRLQAQLAELLTYYLGYPVRVFFVQV